MRITKRTVSRSGVAAASLLMAFSLSACGGSDSASSDPASSDPASSDPASSDSGDSRSTAGTDSGAETSQGADSNSEETEGAGTVRNVCSLASPAEVGKITGAKVARSSKVDLGPASTCTYVMEDMATSPIVTTSGASGASVEAMAVGVKSQLKGTKESATDIEGADKATRLTGTIVGQPAAATLVEGDGAGFQALVTGSKLTPAQAGRMADQLAETLLDNLE